MDAAIPTSPTSCPNCDAALASGQRFCGRCGQKALAARLTVAEIGSDLLHALLHVDHSVLALLRGLALRPGGVARDYVEGRRRRHFGPFAFAVIAAGLASALVAATGLATMYAPQAAAGPVEALRHHYNLVYFLQIPLLAAFCSLLFRAAGRNFAENLVLSAYTTGMRSVVMAAVAIPYAWLTRPAPIPLLLIYAYLAAWSAYFGWAATQFYRGPRALAWLKGGLIAALAQLVLSVLISIAASVWISVAAR